MKQQKQWLIVGIIVAVLTLGAVLGVRLAPDIFPVEVGARAPQFHAIDLATGDSVSLDQWRGEVVLLNIWATWCEPCRLEMPSMERLHKVLGDSGLKIVAVSVDEDDPAGVRAFQREYALTFTILQDRSRVIERIYQTGGGVPESFVINRDGRIIRKVIGGSAWDSELNTDLFRRLLAQRR